jgi:hypothetical protein
VGYATRICESFDGMYNYGTAHCIHAQTCGVGRAAGIHARLEGGEAARQLCGRLHGTKYEYQQGLEADSDISEDLCSGRQRGCAAVDTLPRRDFLTVNLGLSNCLRRVVGQVGREKGRMEEGP